MRFALLLVATLLTQLAPARAQSLFVESTFPLVGVNFDEQAVQVNVSNMGNPEDAPAPCDVRVYFVGFDPTTMVGTTIERDIFTLANGETHVAHVGLTQPMPIKGTVPISARVLVQQTTRRPPFCRASLEVVEVNPPEPEIPMMLDGLERIPGRTTVAIGDPQIRPQAEARFPALTLVTGQALRINAVNIGDPQITPCPVDLDIRDAAGNTVAEHRAALAAGAATSLDVYMTDPNERVQLRAAGERAKDRMVKESCGTFLFSVEIYDLATGKTTLIMDEPEI